MNKKFFVAGIALIMLCLVVTVAFAAADAKVEYDNYSVTVWNRGNGTIPKVELCIIYMDDAGKRQETSATFYNVTRTKQRKPFNLGRVIGAYSTYCAVPIVDKE